MAMKSIWEAQILSTSVFSRMRNLLHSEKSLFPT